MAFKSSVLLLLAILSCFQLVRIHVSLFEFFRRKQRKKLRKSIFNILVYDELEEGKTKRKRTTAYFGYYT